VFSTFTRKAAGAPKHPAFPAPSLVEGKNDQNSGSGCREKAKLYPDVIPGRIEDASPESIAPLECEEKWIPVSDWASLS
jgi:hypothetical protein